MKNILTAFFALLCLSAAAQIQNVGIGTNTPDSTAVLDLTSSTMGFLPPRLSDTERNGIVNPALGLVIFNTTDSTFQFWNGTCWIRSFMESCNDCLFNMGLSDTVGVIDRTLTDTVGFDVFINQTNGSNSVGIFTLHNLPQGCTVTITNPIIQGSGQAHIQVYADIFATPGVYPIAVQAVCGNSAKVMLYELTIDPCYYVAVTQNQTNYDLQAINSLPGVGTPICVVMDVLAGAGIESNNTTVPAYTSGNLDPQSHVGIRNYGSFVARGGNGGAGGNFNNFGMPGQNGGNAINMTCRHTYLNNTNGYVMGGGGGGGSVGISYSVNVPVIGNLGFGIGAGGGGGAALGTGGNPQTPIQYWSAGQSAIAGILATGGNGGNLTTPIPFSISVANVTITPNVHGGNGGGFGVNGGAGNLFVNINISVSIPFIGTVNVVNTNVPNPPIANFPAGGTAGYAIKLNGFPLQGIPVGYYQTSYIKGNVNN